MGGRGVAALGRNRKNGQPLFRKVKVTLLVLWYTLTLRERADAEFEVSVAYEAKRGYPIESALPRTRCGTASSRPLRQATRLNPLAHRLQS
jgi:hypothetical protein